MSRPRPTSLIAAALAVTAVSTAHAADHLDAPAITADGRSDINDLYAFQSPENPDRTILVMTVNPFAGTMSPTDFDPQVSYRFNIDNNGDAVPDLNYTATFDAPVGGTQAFTVTRRVGISNDLYAAGVTGITSPTDAGTGQVRTGVFDDPFFFDLNGFNDSFNFTGDDAFAGANVSAVILEVPSSELIGASNNIGVWAITRDDGGQIDRMGRPAINTVLVPSARKDAFNQAEPANDFAGFGADVNAAIAGLSDQTNADALTPILLPDILTLDVASSAGFLNGRQLDNDVIDASLNLLSAGGVTSDGVNANDRTFVNVFPYLASANPIPEPATAALLAVGLGALAGRRRNRA